MKTLSSKRFASSLAGVVLLLFCADAAAQNICTVTNTAGDLTTPNSLGWCIQQANMSLSPTLINFNIPNTTNPVIVANQDYVITNSVGITIDGYSQNGAVRNTSAVPLPLDTIIAVEVRGNPSGIGQVAVFRIEASNVTISGLAINTGPLYDVAICYNNQNSRECSNNRIQGNFIGTDVTGTHARPSGWKNWNPPYGAGVFLGPNASGNFIGLDENLYVSDRNLISGEAPDVLPGTELVGHGVLLQGRAGQGATRNNAVVGNVIGTTPSLTRALPNNYGITIYSGSAGGIILGNVIAGNNYHGILSTHPAGWTSLLNTGYQIEANAIGLNPNNNVAIPNGQDGIHLEQGTADFVIGGDGDWQRANVISGNGGYGIYINGNYGGSTQNIRIVTNLIGTSVDGNQARPNGMDGVYITATTRSIEVGGPSASTGPANVISGNTGTGVTLAGVGSQDVADSVSVVGNYIGPTLDASSYLPNGTDGVAIGCTDTACSANVTVSGNTISGNGRFGILALATSQTSISGNTIDENAASGIYSVLGSNSDTYDNNDVDLNGDVGILLSGGSPTVSDNTITGNMSWGIAVMPYYAGTYGPAGAGDDLVSDAAIFGNTIDGNASGGIVCQDTVPVDANQLHSDNTIVDNNGNVDVWMLWFGAVEILDQDNNPITSGNYQITLSNDLGMFLEGSTSDGGLWGPDGSTGINPFTYDDVFTWFPVTSFLVDADGTFYQANPWTVTVVGPTSGSASYTFDGIDNDSDQGGQPAGILTGDEFRYQVAEVITHPDQDADGVPDTLDCAPSDPAYQGPLGVPCDADTDGYCDVNISGQVQQIYCTNDCMIAMCDPTDCNDADRNINPGALEGPFGAQACGDSIDNDCDTLVDMNDDGCWECVSASDCSDSNACNGDETCVNHVCQDGDPPDCDDGNDCTVDTCDAVQGCVYAPLSGTSCDDGDSCTMNDTCENGTCTGDPLDADGDGFVAASCPNGDDCDDSNPNVNPDATEGPLGDATCSDGIDNDCDGNFDDGDDGCVLVEVCGDGVLTSSEECDDGNTVPGDGCSDTCAVESGWICRTTVEPSLCGSWADVGEVVITEIMNNPDCVSDSEGEWFEVYNASGRNLVLTGWLLADQGTDSHVITGTLSVNPGQYLVFCRNADPATNGGIACDYEYDGLTLGNGADEVVVGTPDDAVVDIVFYDGGATFPDPTGASMSLDPNYIDYQSNDDGANWCAATTEIGGGCGDSGSPGLPNPPCSGCADSDGDGHLPAACGGDDCDDTDANVHPGAEEVRCNGIDDDCCESGIIECDTPTPDDPDPTDSDADGFTAGCGADCNDNDASVYPGAEEICGDDIDQDCSGSDMTCDCPDADGDGVADASCGGSDCDDTNPEVHPGVPEIECDGIDNDCCESGSVMCFMETPDDPNPSDSDGDGYTAGCGADCDDTNPDTNPGASEVCDDGVDNDCDGDTDSDDSDCAGCQDADSDGYDDAACGGDDCDDSNADINPGAAESCDDGVDNDCDGDTDLDDADCAACEDSDGDGYKDASCGGDDCDDSNESINPGAEEDCTDGIDNDCDGLTDFDDAEQCGRASSGCGCASSQGGPGAFALLALAGLLLLRPRRRRS